MIAAKLKALLASVPDDTPILIGLAATEEGIHFITELAAVELETSGGRVFAVMAAPVWEKARPNVRQQACEICGGKITDREHIHPEKRG